MKYVVLVPDGCADEPIPALGGRTPLEVAHMPHLAALAAHAEVGRADVIPRGLPPGSDVGNMAILGYDAMRIMADAINRAGSTDGAKIRDAIAATRDFPGASGITTIDKDHNAKKSVVILKIDGGQFRYAGTVKPE